jgi:hypothetical protein
LRRGWPSTPRPTGAFITAWVWRATDMPLLAGIVGMRKPEAAETRSARSARRRIGALVCGSDIQRNVSNGGFTEPLDPEARRREDGVAGKGAV